MTVMENIKSKIARQDMNEITTMQSLPEIADQHPSLLQQALDSVDRQAEISDAVQAQAGNDYIDQELLRNLDVEETEDSVSMQEFTEDQDVDQDETTNAVSARILELQVRQNSCRELHSVIMQGTDLLSNLGERANQLSAYLKKSELEIANLESVESHFYKLRSAASKFSAVHHEMSATVETQKQQISALEEHKKSSRETIEKSRIEVGRILEERDAIQSKLESESSLTDRMKSERSILHEKLEFSDKIYDELQDKLDSAQQEIENAVKNSQDLEKDLSKSKSKLSDMDQSIERYRIDLADTRSKHEALSTTYSATKVSLEETEFLLESSRREADEKTCRKEKRIAELEAQNQVLNRQIALNENIIADLDHKFRHLEAAQTSLTNMAAKSVAKESEKSASKKSKAELDYAA